MLRSLLREETGQDVVEYTLLMAILALACAAIILAVGRETVGIWNLVNSRLAAANKAGT